MTQMKCLLWTLTIVLCPYVSFVASAQDSPPPDPAEDEQVEEPLFQTFFELREREQWLLNPIPEPFGYTIGPDSETMGGRLLWLSDRLRTTSASTAGMLKADLTQVESQSPEFASTQAVLDALVAEQPLIEQLLEASRLRIVPIPFEGVPGARERSAHDPLKNASSALRAACRLLLADAIRLWHDGERKNAIDRVTASLRLACPPDEIAEPLMALVRVVIINRTEDVVVAMAESGLTEAQRAVLLTEVSKFDTDDPARISTPWSHRARGWVDYARLRLDGGMVEDELRFALARHMFRARMMRSIGEAFGEELGEESDGEPLVGDPDSATMEQLTVSIDLIENALAEAPAEVWGEPFEAWWAKMETEILADPSGFAFVATQWVPVCREGLIDSRASLQRMLDALDE